MIVTLKNLISRYVSRKNRDNLAFTSLAVTPTIIARGREMSSCFMEVLFVLALNSEAVVSNFSRLGSVRVKVSRFNFIFYKFTQLIDASK